MKNKLSIITFRITSITLLALAFILITNWLTDNNKNYEITSTLNDITNIKIIKNKNKIPYMELDYTKLLKTNKDTIGWIKIDDTDINYSVVQTKDNYYYINHSFNKKKNNAGWIFLDYRNNIKHQKENTIIYGHNRLNGTMFSSLTNLLEKEWHKNNKYIYFNTINNTMTWEVYSVYKVKKENYIPQTSFTELEYRNFIKDTLKNSKYILNVKVTENDQILTLYTCNRSNTHRIIVHAKLVYKK